MQEEKFLLLGMNPVIMERDRTSGDEPVLVERVDAYLWG